MKKRLMKVLVGAMFVSSLFVSKAEANELDNNVLKSGKVVGIEYSEEENISDKLYFEINNQIYIEYGFAEDMCLGDNILVVMNTQNTESLDDDIIMMWRCDENQHREMIDFDLSYYE